MSLKFPKERDSLVLWLRELCDECLRSADDRGGLYTRASSYFYTGSDVGPRAAIYNKTKPFVERLSGMLYQPTDVRFNLLYDNLQDDDVLDRAEAVSEKLTADFRQSDADIRFGEAVTWSLVNGCYILKVRPNKEQHSFSIDPIHPQNFGVMSETTQALEQQEAVCHVSYYSLSKLEEELKRDGHPAVDRVMEEVLKSRTHNKSDEDAGFLHQMVVGGLQPVGATDSQSPSAAGVINVFPLTSPWRPQMKQAETVKLCELWIKDADRDNDWTTVWFIYPDVIVWGDKPSERANFSSVPGHLPFVKVQAFVTPGYFWGRSVVADVQMLQDTLSKRLRDLKVLWDRNANAPMSLSGFSSVTQSMYEKIVSEGGFISDPNPNAKASPLTEAPTPGYLEELQWLFQLFDEAAGFTPVTTGQGESGVRSGVHAQTLVRTSSPRLINQAVTIERNLAAVGELAFRVMQAQDLRIFITRDDAIHFFLHQMPEDFQIEVDSHSASPVFMEDNLQKAELLAKAGVLDGEDLALLIHIPQLDRILARYKKRQKAQAQEQQQEKQEGFIRDMLGLPAHKKGNGVARPQRAR